jgi:hypothetical protein
MNADDIINDAIAQMFLLTRAQFGDAVKSFWFNDSGICPGCGRQVGVVKHKGKDALSLNAFIYRDVGVLIGYFLCQRCMKEVFRTAKRTPGQQGPRHDTIEANLRAAYQQYMSMMDS